MSFEEDLFKKHISVLRNPGIAEILYLARYIERWGTGIEKMNQLMEEYGLPRPDYEEISEFFLVTFKRKEIAIKTIPQTTAVPSGVEGEVLILKKYKN